jgi:DNA-binding transcriptional ArsR family regulator
VTRTGTRRAAQLRSTAARLLRLASEIESDEGILIAGKKGKLFEIEGSWSDLNTQIVLSKAVETYRFRRRRKNFLPPDLFAEPAWDMLLDLFAARLQNRRISVTSACYASDVPSTTALRWLGVLQDAGLVERVENSLDSRSTFVKLSDLGRQMMFEYFEDTIEGSNRIERDLTEYLILSKSGN